MHHASETPEEQLVRTLAEIKGLEDQPVRWKQVLAAARAKFTVRAQGKTGAHVETAMSKTFNNELVVRMLCGLLEFRDYFVDSTEVFKPMKLIHWYDKWFGVSDDHLPFYDELRPV